MNQKTLSLCVIVGPGEAKELERCMESCKGGLFDEVCITHAAREKDEQVMEIASRYATGEVSFFKWCDDFSAARNYNFSQATGKYIMWLDADDKIHPEDYEKLLAFKPEIANYDLIMLQYVYAHDDKGRPVVVLPRERIVRNWERIKWNDPIHEYLNMDADFRMIKKDDIFVHHYRTKPFDPQRNLTLLKKCYESDQVTPRIKFYYGKELADNGNWQEAVPVLEEFIDKAEGFIDNLAVACIKLSRWYFVNQKFNDAKYAENYVILGDTYWEEGSKEAAAEYYKEALSKKVGGAGMSQLADYYGFIPAFNLARLYMSMHDFSKAEKYCKRALLEKPDNNQVAEMLNLIQREMLKGSKDVVLNKGLLDSFKSLAKQVCLDIEIEDNNIDFARVRLSKSAVISVVWMVPYVDNNNTSIHLRRTNVHNKLKDIGVDSRIV